MRVLTHVRIILVVLLSCFSTSQLLAQPMYLNPFATPSSQPIDPNTLIIGVDSNSPPYSVQGGANELYGFDISMINTLCGMLHRTCTFKIMKWVELIPAIMENRIDLAVSDITITPERAKEVHFSIPYALSYSRFLTSTNTNTPEPFVISALNNKKIGVEEGTIYEDQATHLGISNPTIIPYSTAQDAITALTNKQIDYILLDNPSALYWAANTSNVLKVVGTPYVYGYGIGIAVSPNNISLLPVINTNLIQYQNSNDYKENYKRFLYFF